MSGPPLKQPYHFSITISGVACLQGGRPVAAFYPLSNPTPYAYGTFHDTFRPILQGADKTLKTIDGQSMIHLAACRGHKDAVLYFKKKGQSINSRDLQGWTPLHVAAKANGHASFLIFLLENGADPRATTASGSSVLHIACQGAHRKGGSQDQAADLRDWNKIHMKLKQFFEASPYLLACTVHSWPGLLGRRADRSSGRLYKL
jgi:ankyrin repeat protein